MRAAKVKTGMWEVEAGDRLKLDSYREQGSRIWWCLTCKDDGNTVTVRETVDIPFTVPIRSFIADCSCGAVRGSGSGVLKARVVRCVRPS